jgi:hypothetical protein
MPPKSASTHERRPVNVVNITGFQNRTVAQNRQRMGQFHMNQNTMVVRFRYGTVANGRRPAAPPSAVPGAPPPPAPRGTFNGGRTAYVLMYRPSGKLFTSHAERRRWVQQALREVLINSFNRIGLNMSGTNPEEEFELEFDSNGEPLFTVDEIRTVMNDSELLNQLGQAGLPSSAARVPMFGYNEEQEPQHRAFRYMIEGCDMRTLSGMVPQDWFHEDCKRMCTYNMLADLNTPPANRRPIKVFRPESVNRWLNDNGHAVGQLTDGVTSDDIQAHAVQFQYGHCAMDLARSVLNLYIPFENKRNHHYRTACYVVVGDHCQPIVDQDVVHSIMKSASQRMGRRNVIGYGSTFSSSTSSSSAATNKSESIGLQQNQTRRKRRRSLDRVFRPEFERGEERQLQDQWKDNADLSVDHWEDDFSDNGSLQNIPSSARGNDDVKDDRGIRRRIQLPLVTETDRFHFFTRAEDIALVEERCKPTYREGSDPSLIHYYICTDEDDVEFLYNYLIRVLMIDPLRYARSFNGRCRQVRMQNTWWCANRDIRSLMELHGIMQPREPFRMGGMATYGFRMLQQELCRVTRKAGAIWECMSHYPPNLQRLLDTCHPFNRPKLLQCTYQAPYTNPRESPDRQTVRTLIPMTNRFRIDLIRSYASTIRNLKDDQYPIHDPTNVVVPYDDALHQDLPIGHYLVQLPTVEEVARSAGQSPPSLTTAAEDWKKLPCLPLGESRMMSHRMLRALIHRNLLTKANIRLVCATDPFRQNKYGMALVMALQNVLQEIHKSPKLQTICPKALINHLIGLCNGTSVPHSGMRYVFRDLQHLYTLLVNIVSEDQLSRIKVAHIHGYDPLWHKSFEYYEIDSSGLSHRSFHLQPVFNMVLEDQALRVFDIARTIPLKNLIQINVDAIEYHLEDIRQRPQWARDIAEATVDEDSYKALTPAQMYDEYMGRYKAEKPKDETRAMLYHYKFNQPNAHSTLHKFFNGSLGLLQDTEHQDWIPSWKDAMTIYSLDSLNQKVKDDEEAETNEEITTDGMMNQMLTEMFLAEDRSGLLVTGPAGTGKTHWIRLLQNYAVNLSHVVVKTAYTHAACVQMGSDAVTLHSLFGMDEKSDMRYTLSMSPKFMAQMRQLEIDVLIVDEISMIPLILLEVLMMFHRVSPKTRICLFGDFHQLAPVEPQWDRPESYNYFQKTDMFPYLVYDRVRNTHGRWVQLTDCMRTSDPLLVAICKDPLSVQTITPADFPMPPTGIPIWRFISWRNTTRKATNYFCGYRYLQMHPDATRATLCLCELYAQRKYTEYQRKKRMPGDTTQTDTSVPILDLDYFRKQFATTYKPAHWIYLQNTFTYAVGMEVVCRNTLKQWNGTGDNNNNNESSTTNSSAAVCTNNRRGRIVDIDTETQVLTIRWVDVIRRHERRLQEQEEQETNKKTGTTNPTDEPDDTNTWKNTPLGLEEEDVVLAYYDFAFNFVPGFCITAHMAQGETIKEHYGIMEWQEMVTMPRMAYVAVSRGSTSQYLHIVPPYANPWNITDTSSLEDNILHKLFINFRWDKNQVYDIQVDEIKQRIIQKPVCVKCNVNLLLTRFNYKSKDQFCLTSSQPKTQSLSLDTCLVVCDNCFQSIVFPKKNPPVIPVADADPVPVPVVLDDDPVVP